MSDQFYADQSKLNISYMSSSLESKVATKIGMFCTVSTELKSYEFKIVKLCKTSDDLCITINASEEFITDLIQGSLVNTLVIVGSKTLLDLNFKFYSYTIQNEDSYLVEYTISVGESKNEI